MPEQLYVPKRAPLVDPKTGRITQEWEPLMDGLVRILATLDFEGITGTIALAQLVAHKSTHQSGGADAIKIDDLAAGDDNTDLDTSTTRHGLCPKLEGSTSRFLRADGQWAVP